MQRKVIQIANSTYLVSLPKAWMEARSICKGDLLSIEEQGNALLIRSGSIKKKNSIEKDVSHMDRDMLMFFIRMLYVKGYSSITLKFSEKYTSDVRLKQKVRIIDVIAKEVTRLPGVEIFSQKEDFCIITSITEDSIKEFDSMFRRVFLLTREIIADFKEGFMLYDTDILKSIQLKHDTITKLINYSQRVLNTIGKKDIHYDATLIHILNQIDILVDIIKFCSRDLLTWKTKASQQSINVLDVIISQFEDLYSFFYKYDFKKIYNINIERYTVLDLVSIDSKKIPKQEFMILTQLRMASDTILHIATSILSFQEHEST